MDFATLVPFPEPMERIPERVVHARVAPSRNAAIALLRASTNLGY
jgi:hypothetical protein